MYQPNIVSHNQGCVCVGLVIRWCFMSWPCSDHELRKLSCCKYALSRSAQSLESSHEYARLSWLHIAVHKIRHKLLLSFSTISAHGYYMAARWTVQYQGSMHGSPHSACEVVCFGDLKSCVVMQAEGLLSLSGVALSRKAHLGKFCTTQPRLSSWISLLTSTTFPPAARSV